jgi:hypothetical protein
MGVVRPSVRCISFRTTVKSVLTLAAFGFPLLHILMLLALYILELQTYEQWKLYYATELVSAASCLHVFCSTIVVLVIELGPLVKASVAGFEFDNADDDGSAENDGDDDGLLLLSMRVNAWFVLLFIGGLVIQVANGAVLTGGEALIMARIQLQHGGGGGGGSASAIPPPHHHHHHHHPHGLDDAKYADGLLASSSRNDNKGLGLGTTLPRTGTGTGAGGWEGPATIVYAGHRSNHSDPFEDIDLNAVDDDEVSSYERSDPHYYPLKNTVRSIKTTAGPPPVDRESLANSCDLASEGTGHLSSYAALDDTIAEAHLRSSGNLLAFDSHLRSSGNLLSSSSSDNLLRSSGNLLSPDTHHRASGNLRSSADRFGKLPYE